VKQVHAEIEKAARHRLAVHEQVLLGQMPAARPHHDGRQVDRIVQGVVLAVRAGELERAVDGVAQVQLALDHVQPQRGVRILEIREPDLRTRVQRVDGHLRVGGSGDLDPAIEQAGRGFGHSPVTTSDVLGVSEERQRCPGVDLCLSRCPRPKQAGPAGAEPALQIGHERQRLRSQDLVVGS
jgi:hypothetical protein